MPSLSPEPDRSLTSRRTFLRRGSAVAVGAAAFGFNYRSIRAAHEIEVLKTRVISPQPDIYYGWPTICRRSNGELWLVWSGGREAHVCPFGKVEAMTSADDGSTWTWPRTLLDSALDDRDAGICETATGALLVSTFTSLAYEPVLDKAAKEGGWPPEKLARWKAVHSRSSPEKRRAELGQWILRSTDGGLTWSSRQLSIVNSPHGPTQLNDGRLLYAGKELWTEKRRIGVCESKDDGQTWNWLSEIPTRAGDNVRDGYHELHAVEAADGRIVVQIRNHNAANNQETLQCESADGGRTWTEPRPIGVWGLPSHLLRLRDGRLLMTYGHRRAPFGNQARISEDHGRTWGEAIAISGDGTGGDLGYPSTVELADGTFLSVWYEVMKGNPNATLRQARWRLA